jgi:hypothetical protein
MLNTIESDYRWLKALPKAEVIAEYPTRQARIIDHGWDAYAREEGHYDIPDSY